MERGVKSGWSGRCGRLRGGVEGVESVGSRGGEGERVSGQWPVWACGRGGGECVGVYEGICSRPT
jgi:hypothetical protein